MEQVFKNSGLLKIISKENFVAPGTVSGTWQDNYDILHFDRTVKAFLDNKVKNELPVRIREKETLEEIKKTSKTKFQIEEINYNIETIDKEISKLKEIINDYVLETKKYLDRYKKNRDPHSIERYFEIVRQFYPHQITRDNSIFTIKKCPEHNVELQRLDNIEDEESFDEKKYCPVCFTIFHVPEDFSKYENEKRRDHDIIENFEKNIDLVEGRDSYFLHPSIRQKLDIYLSKNDIEKNSLTKKTLLTVLKAVGESHLKPHLSKIAFDYCGIKPPDLGEYRPEIKDDCVLYAEALKIVEFNRTSALNSAWVLYKIIQRRNYPLELEEFRPEISKPTLKNYNIIWSKICKENNWEFIPEQLG